MNRTYVYFISFVAALGGFLFGFDTAIINGALVFLKREFLLSNLQVEFAASSLLGGCIAGTACAGILGDRFGRKLVLLSSAALFGLAAIGAAVPRNLTDFVIARIVGGLAIGLVSTLVPLYIAEVAPAAKRGRFVSFYQFAIVVGILLAYVVSALLAPSGSVSWRWMFASAAVPSAIFFAALLVVPESPRWLIERARPDEALTILRRIEPAESLLFRMGEIQASISGEHTSLRNLLEPLYRPALIIGAVLACACQITGINTIIYYGAFIFTEQAGKTSDAVALRANMIIGVVNLLATIITLAFVDAWGRKRLLLWSSGGMAISLALLGLCIRLDLGPTISLVMILGIVAFFAIGLGPVVWVLISEIFPTAIRGKAASLATLVLWTSCLLVTLTFLSLVNALGAAGAFWLYATLSLASFVFILRAVPETKGKTLEEIQQNWQHAKPVRQTTSP